MSAWQKQVLEKQGHLRGGSAGRNQALFIDFQGGKMVLRRFSRGGLFGRVNRDLYLRTGLNGTRPMQEFALLSWMRGQGLSVPRPIAAQVAPLGPFYRAALLTERITGAKPLDEHLKHAPLHAGLWAQIGATVQKLHAAGVYHSDLNCRNILLDDADQVWVAGQRTLVSRDGGRRPMIRALGRPRVFRGRAALSGARGADRGSADLRHLVDGERGDLALGRGLPRGQVRRGHVRFPQRARLPVL